MFTLVLSDQFCISTTYLTARETASGVDTCQDLCVVRNVCRLQFALLAVSITSANTRVRVLPHPVSQRWVAIGTVHRQHVALKGGPPLKREGGVDGEIEGSGIARTIFHRRHATPRDAACMGDANGVRFVVVAVEYAQLRLE